MSELVPLVDLIERAYTKGELPMSIARRHLLRVVCGVNDHAMTGERNCYGQPRPGPKQLSVEQITENLSARGGFHNCLIARVDDMDLWVRSSGTLGFSIPSVKWKETR